MLNEPPRRALSTAGAPSRSFPCPAPRIGPPRPPDYHGGLITGGNRMRWKRPALACLLGMLLCGASLLGQAAKTDLKIVTYSELGQLVRGLKGKVVVVYFWADY